MDDQPLPHRIYSWTSIGRPLEPAVPSNKAVLVLVPLMAVVGCGYGLYSGSHFGVALQVAAAFALSVFGTWALARELQPDDPVAAFICMALGLLVALAYSQPGLLVLFSTLALVRIVNRSTGLMPRPRDSIIVTLLVIVSIYSSQCPWLGGVAALAFFLDGILHKPVKRQWLYALICFIAMVVYMVDHDVAWWIIVVPDSLLEWVAVLSLLLFSLNLVLLRKVHSRGDVDQVRLDLQRVKAGMGIGILATLQGLEVMPQVALLVVTVSGLCLGAAFRRAFRNPAKGLRGN